MTQRLLSMDQRQRLGIARALYKDPKILILDEATSFLDQDTEYLILKELFKNTDLTIICISHRLRVLEFCDKAFELKDNSLTILNKGQK